MITSETLPGILLGLAIIAVGTFLGVRSTLRREAEERAASDHDLRSP
ncbi:MAG: hypothetical protein QMD96_05315 [Anaerosomatales bacterium]|nr:hypothetical protein [Anaerosomatales bacterium]